MIAQLPLIAQALEVRWDAPADLCPDTQDVAARVERTLGPRAEEEGELLVEARVSREGDHWRLQVRLAGLHQSDWSTLTAQSCEALAEATAVIVAALLPPPAPVAIEQPPATEEPEPPRLVPLALEASISAGAEWGALPQVSPSLQVGFALMIGRLRGAIGGGVFWPREASLGAFPEARPQVGLYTAAIGICYDLALGRTLVSPCARAEAGQLFARERGLASGGTGRAPWIAPGGSLAVRIPIRGRWSLGPEVLVFAPLRKASFYVGPAGEAVVAHESRALSLRGVLTLGLRFWSLEKLW